MIIREADNTMGALERDLWRAEIGDTKPRLTLRTNTRIDAGRWWRRARLWLCITEDEVVILVAARRHYIERLPLADCRGSCYCHTTGELVIDAGEGIRFSRLAMVPTDALRVIEFINNNDQRPRRSEHEPESDTETEPESESTENTRA